jgi:predicted flap endonuclease-1-like 5' DNA nuclease
MVVAAEFTVTTLVAWAVAILAVGFVLGWILRPWLIRDRLREEYEAKLSTERGRANSAEDRLATVQEDLATSKTALDTARADVIRVGASLATAEGRTDELESTLADLQLEKAAETERVGAESGKVVELEAALAEREERIAQMEQQLAATATEAERLVEAEAALAALGEEHRGCAAVVVARDVRIAELEEAVAHAATGSTAAAAGLDTAPPDEETVLPHEEPGVPDKETATRKVAEIAARTRGRSARVEDDLERIHGIGPKIDALLKAMDITSYAQIANFEPDDIAYVAAALESFPDRITRDDWMMSAAALHAEKYGDNA